MNAHYLGRHANTAATLLRSFGAAVAAVALALCMPAMSVAANTGVSQGYTTTETNLAAGTIMGLSPNTNTAAPATSGKNYQLLGLVADAPLIALNDGSHQVQIVVSGSAKALVSDINGEVKAGDKITSSPIVGVGMKATDAGQIVGIAQGDLAKSTTSSETITDKTGKSQTVHIGAVALQVSVSYYAGSSDQSALSSVLPPFILHTANGIAGQQVSPVRVLISLIALVFGFAIVGNMLQSAIRSNIIATGRNPLAKQALRRELVDISITALGILLLTTLTTYLVIKL